MIYKHYGLKLTEMERSAKENEAINNEFLSSGIKLGVGKENEKMEALFLECFAKYDTPIFLYSDFPKEDGEMGGGEDLSRLIFDLASSVTSDITINFLSSLVSLHGPEIFKKLKYFLLEAHKEKPQTTIIRINNEYGASAEYKLPKYLLPTEIETGVDTIERMNGDEKIIQSRLWTKVTFDRKSEEFKEE